jgi:hypothetical protein
MSKTKKGSNAIFTGPQKGLTTIGKHCYAYSGVVTTVGSTATLLDFTTSKNYIYVETLKMNISSQTISGVNYSFTVKFNGQIVLTEFYTNPYAGRQPADSDNIYMIIPPLTHVTVEFLSSSGEKECSAMLVGEVYG